MATVNTEELLAERQKTHGEYAEHARCTQTILRALQAERGYSALSDMQKETLHMIAHKMGRIVTGNPDIADHYDDIAGYAKLISQRLENPVVPYDSNTDSYAALAKAWGCSREEAKERFYGLSYSMERVPRELFEGINRSVHIHLSDAQQTMLNDRKAQHFTDEQLESGF
jgi:hypothetical protein